MQYFTLNNGYKIPAVGTGTNTFGKENHDYMGVINNDITELASAINAGYTLIDTAVGYRNEAVVGKALNDAKVNKDEYFVTTKLPGKLPYIKDADSIRKTVLDSLKALDLKRIDLYLIHHPWDDLKDILSVWRVLETLVDEGLIVSIGVSNFSIDELTYLLTHAKIKPVVNQIESHPGFYQKEIVDFCHQNQIVPQAWGPLTRISDEAKETLTAIGKKYQKSYAQVALRYHVQNKTVVIPKSHNKQRQKDNISILDFSLTKEEMNIIGAL